MARKDKKNRKQRAGTTHGYGSMKKNRGAGNRGGRGMAGTGKRGDANKPSINPKTYFGNRGFRRLRQMPPQKIITIATLDRTIDTLVSQKKAEFSSGTYSVDLKKLGYEKLLGTGKSAHKFNISIENATESSVKKIESTGGKVIIPSKPAEKSKNI